MLMNDYQGDCGSMDEDLAVLGLKPLVESQGTRGESGSLVEDTQTEGSIPPQFLKNIKKKKDAAKDGSDDDSEDDDSDDGDDSDDDKKKDYGKKAESANAEGRIEVDPRSEESDEGDEGAEPITEDTELDIEQMCDIAEEWEVEPLDFFDFLNEQFGLDCESFLTEDEIDDLVASENITEDDDEGFGHKTDAAHAVLGSFYEQLEQVQESEDEDTKPSYDNLVGVIESYEHVHDDILEEVETILEMEDLEEAKKGFRRLKAKLRLGKRKFMKSAAGKKLKRVAKRMHSRGMHLVGGVKMRAGAFMRHMRKKLKGAHGKMARKYRGVIKGAKGKGAVTAGEHRDGTPLSELVSNLNSLRDQVNEQDDVVSAGDELLEGLKSVHDVATSYFTRIAEEVQESEEVAEDDARVIVGRHLEQIAEDARRVAEGMVEGNGEFTLDDYADDLTALAADLDESMEAMKAID
jgi:hypothetical protein